MSKKTSTNTLCTIYILKNKCNSKVYVGQICGTLHDRWHSGNGYKNCIHLHKAITKYGKKQFYYEVLTFTSTQETADSLEEYFIKHFDSINNGYNLRLGGSRGKHSKQTKNKMSAASIGKKKSESHIKSMSESHKGKLASDETKLKMSESRKGENHYFYGKHLSDDHKRKISKSEKGKIISEDHKMKIGAASKGNKYRLGIKRSDETKIKLSEINSGENCRFVKLTKENVTEIRKLHFNFKITAKELAIMFNVSYSCITRILGNITWQV